MENRSTKKLLIVVLDIMYILLASTTVARPADSLWVSGTYHGSRQGKNFSDSGKVWVGTSSLPLSELEMYKSYGYASRLEIHCRINESFRIKMPIKKAKGYLFLSCKNDSPQTIYAPLFSFDNIYVLDGTNNIHCDLYDDSIAFAGKRSIALQCQREIYMNKLEYSDEYIELLNTGKIKQALIWQDEHLDSSLRQQFSILDKYRKSLPPELYRTIEVNCYAQRYYNQLRNLRMTILDNMQGAKDAYDFYMGKYFHKQIFSVAQYGEAMELQAPLFSLMVFEKERADLELEEFNGVSDFPKPAFKDYYKCFANKYKESLRDQLLVLAFFWLSNGHPEALEYIQPAIELVHEEQYKYILKQISFQKKGMPWPSYPFTDSIGKDVTPNSMLGKVLIVDFWYSGCINCIFLKKAMRPVFERFRSDSLINFVSISIDKERETWLGSIGHGLYTDKCELNLYTGGVGERHSSIKKMGIIGYPKLLILVNGKIFEFNPPIPTHNDRDDDQTISEQTKNFIRLIDEAKKFLSQ